MTERLARHFAGRKLPGPGEQSSTSSIPCKELTRWVASMRIERASGNPKGHPEMPYTRKLPQSAEEVRRMLDDRGRRISKL